MEPDGQGSQTRSARLVPGESSNVPAGQVVQATQLPFRAKKPGAQEIPHDSALGIPAGAQIAAPFSTEGQLWQEAPHEVRFVSPTQS